MPGQLAPSKSSLAISNINRDKIRSFDVGEDQVAGANGESILQAIHLDADEAWFLVLFRRTPGRHSAQPESA